MIIFLDVNSIAIKKIIFTNTFYYDDGPFVGFRLRLFVMMTAFAADSF